MHAGTTRSQGPSILYFAAFFGRTKVQIGANLLMAPIRFLQSGKFIVRFVNPPKYLHSKKVHTMSYSFHPDHIIPTAGWVWVFGSNQGGRHGKGAAKVAHVNFGAVYGVGAGVTGSAYAIPTKSKNLQTLPLSYIKDCITEFQEVARNSPTKKYFITRVGCGLAGYTDESIAPFFKGSPPNCNFSEDWRPYL